MLNIKLNTLLVLVSKGSFTAAALELHLTQPAVSHQIRMLEQEFGIKIFIPDHKNLRTTQEGDILIQYARRILALEEQAQQDISDCRSGTRHISIGITQTENENKTPQILATYCSEHIGTSISITTAPIKKLYSKLEQYEIDVAIVEGAGPTQKFNSILLGSDYLCVVSSPEHSFAKKGSVELQELKNQNLIMRPAGTSTRMLFDSYLLSHGESIRNFHIMMELDNIAALKELVIKNAGVSVIAHSACREEEQRKQLVTIPIKNADMIRDIRMIYNPDFMYEEFLEDFRRLYVQYAQ